VPVNYIAGRDLLLMMLFLTASFLVYANLRRRGDSVGRWCTVLGLLALSLLSKANAIMAFAIIFLFEYLLMRTRLTEWRLWTRVAAFGAATGGFFVVTFLTAPPTIGVLRTPTGNSYPYPLTMLKTHLFYYFRNVVWPFEMRPLAWIEMVESLADLQAVVGAVFILATMVLAWYLRKRSPLVAFSILAYWVLFSLTSSIFPFHYVVMDYRQYPPLAFLCLALAIGLFTLRRFRIDIVAVTALTLYFGLASISMNTVWRTEESFWGQSVRYGGRALAHANYGLSVEPKDPKLAEFHYLEALRLEPNYRNASMNLGLLYVAEAREDEGLALLQEIVARDPRWAVGHFGLAEGYRKLGRDDEAVAAQRRAADLDPRRLRYQLQAARALQRAGDVPASIPYLERVTAINPNYLDTLFLLAVAHEKSARGDFAIAAYRGFLSNHPDHVEARFGLGSALANAGDCGEAVAHFERVLALQPGLAAAHRHLAACYRTLGEDVKAAEHATMYERLTP
jgi:tetratricopeptide (TPR) repeat protein